MPVAFGAAWMAFVVPLVVSQVMSTSSLVGRIEVIWNGCTSMAEFASERSNKTNGAGASARSLNAVAKLSMTTILPMVKPTMGALALLNCEKTNEPDCTGGDPLPMWWTRYGVW